MENKEEYKFIGPPEVKSYLYITPSFVFHSPDKYPNIWIRFWYKILLGWEWKKVS